MTANIQPEPQLRIQAGEPPAVLDSCCTLKSQLQTPYLCHTSVRLKLQLPRLTPPRHPSSNLLLKGLAQTIPSASPLSLPLIGISLLPVPLPSLHATL